MEEEGESLVRLLDVAPPGQMNRQEVAGVIGAGCETRIVTAIGDAPGNPDGSLRGIRPLVERLQRREEENG